MQIQYTSWMELCSGNMPYIKLSITLAHGCLCILYFVSLLHRNSQHFLISIYLALNICWSANTDSCNLTLCQVIEISEYRTQLYDYLKNRMMAIAPNLTVMVGELVGARLIAHAGGLH